MVIKDHGASWYISQYSEQCIWESRVSSNWVIWSTVYWVLVCQYFLLPLLLIFLALLQIACKSLLREGNKSYPYDLDQRSGVCALGWAWLTLYPSYFRKLRVLKSTRNRTGQSQGFGLWKYAWLELVLVLAFINYELWKIFYLCSIRIFSVSDSFWESLKLFMNVNDLQRDL